MVGDEFHLGEPCAACSRAFVPQSLGRIVGRGDPPSVEPHKIAVDPFLAHDPLDRVHAGAERLAQQS